MFFLNYEDNLAYEQEYENYILEKMKEQRQENINFFKTIVRQDLAEDFAMILSAAHDYESPEAEKIAEAFGLNQSDFFSIDNKYKEYKENYESKIWRENE